MVMAVPTATTQSWPYPLQSQSWPYPLQPHNHRHCSDIAVAVTYSWPLQSHTHGRRSHIPMAVPTAITYPWPYPLQPHTHGRTHCNHILMTTAMAMTMWLQWSWLCGCSGHGYVIVMAMIMWLQWLWVCDCDGDDYVAAMAMTMWLQWSWVCDCDGDDHVVAVAMGMWLRWRWLCGCNGHDHVVAVAMSMWLRWPWEWICDCDGHEDEYVTAMAMRIDMWLYDSFQKVSKLRDDFIIVFQPMYNRCSPEIDIQPLNNRYITVLNLRGGPRQYSDNCYYYFQSRNYENCYSYSAYYVDFIYITMKFK